MIAIIDYGMGNIKSIANAFHAIGHEAVVTNEASVIQKADKLVLPGVGAFGDGISNLKSLGLVNILSEQVLVAEKPILGICLGMQLFAEVSHEFGTHDGLGWIKGVVRKLPSTIDGYKVPHVGWSDILVSQAEPILKNFDESPVFYFVHSYYFDAKENSSVSSTFKFGQDFTASVQQGNIFGVQFHPEKSQRSGMKILENFSRL